MQKIGLRKKLMLEVKKVIIFQAKFLLSGQLSRWKGN